MSKEEIKLYNGDCLETLKTLKDVCIKIPFEEYKELLIIKGKYEELKRLQQPLIVWDGRKEDGTTILPQREIRTTDPFVTPPYRITCEEKK